MLSSFIIKNFKSILDLTVDFSYAEGKAPNRYKELDTIPFLNATAKDKVIPCLSIYGANASGKTNIIKALFNLKEVVKDGIKGKFYPNRLNRKFAYTFFKINFYIDKVLYSYTLQYDEKEIINEALFRKNKTIFEIRSNLFDFSNIVTKTYDDKKLREIFDVECRNTEKEQRFTFLNKIASNYPGLNKYISEVFDYFLNKIEVYPQNRFPMAFGMDKLVESNNAKEINEAFDKIVIMLRKLDIDISRMSFERTLVDMQHPEEWIEGVTEIFQNKNNQFFINNVYSYHKDINGEEVKFKFQEESEGTQIVAGILGVFLSALSRGGVLIIDELEKSLHPLILTEIIRLFKDKRYNLQNAQLVFTAHNTDILDDDLLRVSEIAIVRKTLEYGSTLRRVAEFDGIRNVSNFRRQYLQGTFSGIPHPYI